MVHCRPTSCMLPTVCLQPQHRVQCEHKVCRSSFTSCWFSCSSQYSGSLSLGSVSKIKCGSAKATGTSLDSSASGSHRGTLSSTSFCGVSPLHIASSPSRWPSADCGTSCVCHLSPDHLSVFAVWKVQLFSSQPGLMGSLALTSRTRLQRSRPHPPTVGPCRKVPTAPWKHRTRWA